MVYVLLFVWLAGTIYRIWRLARFYQIEGYDSSRYLRWLVAKVDRYIVWRALIFVGLALVITIVLNILGQNTNLLHLVIWGAASVLSIWPEPVKEVKQEFKLTQRAARLVGTAFALAILTLFISYLVMSRAFGLSTTTQFATMGGIGLVLFHLSPLFLPLANVLMYPVEATFRRMFLGNARRTLRQANPVVIGITGSFGKTSTKEYLAHILSGRYRVLATPKSYNTLMGVCIVINNHLKNDYSYDYFIVEMGAYVEGEIREICELTRPQISVVTAVGPQHLERFGSIEAIIKAKYEIIEALPPDGLGVFNWDNAYVRAMYERGYPENRIAVTWQNAEHAMQLRFRACNIKISTDGMAFDIIDSETGEEQRVTTSLLGEHNITNILLAAAVARSLGLSLVEIALRVATLEPAEHRLHRRTLPGGVTIIDDAYSANPVGAHNALDVLAMYNGGRRVLITPGIVELGALHAQENNRLGQHAAEVCTDIVLVGVEQTRPLQRGVRDAGFSEDRLYVFETREEAIAWFQSELQSGDTILFLNDLPDTYL